MSISRCLSLVCAIVPGAVVWAADSGPAAALIEHGHFKQARPILEKRLSANPKDAEALVLMAKVKLAYQDLDGAIEMAKEAVDVGPKNADAHVTFADALSRKTDDAGLFEKMRLAKQLKSETELAVTLDPKNIDALEGLMAFYREAPGIAGGSMSKARELADKIMAIDRVRGYFAKIDLAGQDKQLDQFEGLYLKALEGDPKSYLANARIAAMYTAERWKDYDKAIRYAQVALSIDATRVSAYLTLTSVYSSREQWAELDKLLATAEKEIPDNLLPYYTAARTLLMAGKDLPRAERYFRKYLTQEPEGGAPPLAGAHWRLGQILEKEGRKDEAVKEVQMAIDMKPSLVKQNLEEAKKDLRRLMG